MIRVEIAAAVEDTVRRGLLNVASRLPVDRRMSLQPIKVAPGAAAGAYLSFRDQGGRQVSAGVVVWRAGAFRDLASAAVVASGSVDDDVNSEEDVSLEKVWIVDETDEEAILAAAATAVDYVRTMLDFWK